jgi:hypothetical protein
MKMKAGSRVIFVSKDRLLKVFFSVQAHTPMAKMLRPINCKQSNIVTQLILALWLHLPKR